MFMTHGSLFSGIGGFDLAAEWMGWENKFHCEWNEFGQKILKHYWPQAETYGDITKTDFTIWRGRIDILTGGFPCQPYSVAGKRKGKEDERHLWPEMLRAIREIQPRYIVGENVRGIVSWDGGLVFNEVQADLEAEGYSVLPVILPACGVNAPHRRERVWFIAYNTNTSVESMQQRRENGIHELRNAANTKCEGLQKPKAGEQYNSIFNAERNDTQNATDTSSPGRKKCNATEKPNNERHGSRSIIESWAHFPTQSPVCGGNDGLPSQLDRAAVFAGIPFPRKPITFAKWRNESIKGFGNAVVPELPYQIFKAIEAHERLFYGCQ